MVDVIKGSVREPKMNVDKVIRLIENLQSETEERSKKRDFSQIIKQLDEIALYCENVEAQLQAQRIKLKEQEKQLAFMVEDQNKRWRYLEGKFNSLRAVLNKMVTWTGNDPTYATRGGVKELMPPALASAVKKVRKILEE